MINKKYIKNVPLFLKKNKITILTIIFLATISDILFSQESSDFIIFVILGIYALAIRTYIIKSGSTFLFCLLLLSIMYIEFILRETSVRTEKTAVWLFLFMATGILQRLREASK